MFTKHKLTRGKTRGMKKSTWVQRIVKRLIIKEILIGTGGRTKTTLGWFLCESSNCLA